MDLLIQTIAVLITLIISIIIYMKWRITYWQRRKMPVLQPSIPLGNFENPFTTNKSQGKHFEVFHLGLKAMGADFGGVYALLTPIFMPVDPAIIKNVLTKDFPHFHARGFYANEEDQPISAHLFSIDGTKWKILRAKFTPTFTPAKMKTMFETVLNCTHSMKEKLRRCAHHRQPLVVKDFSAYYTTDVIGSCVFGLECNSFTDPEAKIYNLVRYAVDEATKLIKLAFFFSFPRLSKKLRMVQFPQDAAAFFTKIIVDMIAYREKNNVRRGDFLQVLIDMKNQEVLEANEEVGKLTENEIVAQSFLFFMAGFDTSSILIMFSLFELASNNQIQQRVRKEINAVLAKHNNEFTYESVNDMKYLQQIIDETLRKYPSLPVINRECTEDYKLPNTNHVIEKGTQVVVSILGLHHDPENYPNPEKYDPDRFSEECKNLRDPYTYLPFGDGPRHCIGLRFGIMQAKTGLAVLIKDFDFSLNAKTKIPLQFTSRFLLTPSEDILLDVACVNE